MVTGCIFARVTRVLADESRDQGIVASDLGIF